jgi:hypothetical protein
MPEGSKLVPTKHVFIIDQTRNWGIILAKASYVLIEQENVKKPNCR